MSCACLIFQLLGHSDSPHTILSECCWFLTFVILLRAYRFQEEAEASATKGKRAQGNGRLKHDEWLARRDMVASQCVAWSPCVWASPSGTSPCSLLAVGSRGLVGLCVWGLGEGGAQGRLKEQPAVVLPAREVSCLAWHVEEGEDAGMVVDGEGGGEKVGPGVLLAYGTSEGVVWLFRVSCRWQGEGGLKWDMVPLMELCRPSVRRVQCLSFRGGVGEFGDVLVAAMGPMLMTWRLTSEGPVKVQAEPEAHEDTVVSLDWGYGGEGQAPQLFSGGLEGTFKVRGLNGHIAIVDIKSSRLLKYSRSRVVGYCLVGSDMRKGLFDMSDDMLVLSGCASQTVVVQVWEAKAGPAGLKLHSSELNQPPLRAG